MKIALYKSIRPGIQGIFSHLVRWWTGGIYSHGELIFSDGVSASSSWLDGGVRFKKIEFDASHWDFFNINIDEEKARKWFEDHLGCKFDLKGLFGFVFKRGMQDKNKFFCTEAIMAAAGYPEAWRFDPCILAAFLYDTRE